MITKRKQNKSGKKRAWRTNNMESRFFLCLHFERLLKQYSRMVTVSSDDEEWDEKLEEARRGKGGLSDAVSTDKIRSAAQEYILDQSSRSSSGGTWAASLKLSPALHAALLEEHDRHKGVRDGQSMSIEFQSRGIVLYFDNSHEHEFDLFT
jgi:hypothetical protein